MFMLEKYYWCPVESATCIEKYVYWAISGSEEKIVGRSQAVECYWVNINIFNYCFLLLGYNWNKAIIIGKQ